MARRETTASRLDSLIQEYGNPWYARVGEVYVAYHQRYGVEPSVSSVSKAITRARNKLRNARPETGDWRWTGEVYEHRRDPAVRLELHRRDWALTFEGRRLIHERTRSVIQWKGSDPASILPFAANEAEPFLREEDSGDGPDYDGISEVTRCGL